MHTRVLRWHRVLPVRSSAPVPGQRRKHGMRRVSAVAVGVKMAGQPCIPIQNSVPVVDYEKRSWSEATVVNFSNFYSLTRTRHGLWKRAFRMRGTEGVEFLQFFHPYAHASWALEGSVKLRWLAMTSGAGRSASGGLHRNESAPGAGRCAATEARARPHLYGTSTSTAR